MPQSTAAGGPGKDKPAKPYPDFPLYAHRTRRWAKRIRGKIHYFGPWDDWQAALKKYQEQKDDLFAGRTPRVQGDGLNVRDLVNRFLTSKKLLADTGELAARTFGEYHGCCSRIVETFGRSRLVEDLTSTDFEKLRSKLASTRGVVALGNEIQRVRSVFKYAYDEGLIDRPLRFGTTFKRPNRKALRQARAARGERMFEAAQLRQLLEAAGVQMKAMILLGINCGFGNADLGKLPIETLDLEKGWVKFPRPKTGVERRCPLWPETIEALKASLDARVTPRDQAHAGLVFITAKGGSWFKEAATPESLMTPQEDGRKASKKIDSPISKEMAKLLRAQSLSRPGLNFYALRHTFETIAGESRDQVAVDHIMGHAPDSSDMASIYRERISNERLKAVTDHVHAWLFPQEKPPPKVKKAPRRPQPERSQKEK